MKKKKYWDWYDLADYVLPFTLVTSIIEYVLGFWAFTTVAKVAAVAISLVIAIKYNKRKELFSNLLLAYIFYCLLTGISYFSNSKPLSLYFADISDYLMPMLFFFVGVTDNRPSRTFYDRFIKVLVVVMVLGLICYLLTPPWYTSRMAEIRNDSMDYYAVDSDSVLDNLRFCAFFRTSYPISHFTSFGIAIALFNLFRKDIKIKYNTLIVTVLVTSSLLCQHRVAIICGAFFLALAILYGVTHKEFNKVRPFVFLFIVVLLGILVLFNTVERFQELYLMLTERLDDVSLEGALQERKQIDDVFRSWNDVFLGEGIGAGGAAARRIGLYGITDQNYAKLLYETGIMGCLFFSLLMILTIIKGLRNYKVYATELCFMVFVLVAMMGSNTLCFYYLYILPFWYGVGRIWNKTYLIKARNNKILI